LITKEKKNSKLIIIIILLVPRLYKEDHVGGFVRCSLIIVLCFFASQGWLAGWLQALGFRASFKGRISVSLASREGNVHHSRRPKVKLAYHRSLYQK
jgi:hypothetical protein